MERGRDKCGHLTFSGKYLHAQSSFKSKEIKTLDEMVVLPMMWEIREAAPKGLIDESDNTENEGAFE